MGDSAKRISTPELPGVRRNILAAITLAEERRRRFFVYASSAAVPLSGFAALFALRLLSDELSQSAFYNYMSLLLSDTDIVVAYWKEFALTLAESAPLFGITVSLAALGALLVAARAFARSVRRVSPSLRTI